MKHLDTLKWPDFSGFDSFDSKWNPTLERASNTLRKLAQIIIDNNWTLDEPMIVWLHGKPWLWKSHLMDAFLKAIQGVKWSKITKPNNTQFFLIVVQIIKIRILFWPMIYFKGLQVWKKYFRKRIGINDGILLNHFLIFFLIYMMGKKYGL